MTNFGEYVSSIWNVSDPERLKMIRDPYAAEVYDGCRKAAAADH